MGSQLVKGDNWLALQYVFVMETLFFFLIIMCAIMGITLFIFVSYHFYLINARKTTNERVKKNDYIDYLKKERKNIKEYMKNNPKLPEKVSYKGDKLSAKEFNEYAEDVEKRLAVLEYNPPNPGFLANLRAVFAEPDN